MWRPRNSTNKPPSNFISGRLEGALAYALRAHLKEMLHQEPRVNSEDFFCEALFLEKFLEKCPIFLENFKQPKNQKHALTKIIKQF